MRLEYFQLIDQIETIDPTRQEIRVRATVPEQSTIFEGHFPGYPLMPGVLLIESMAQTAGCLLLARDEGKRLPLLVQVEKAKLRSFVRPGTILTVEATVVQDDDGYGVTRAKISKDSKVVADAELRFRLMPFPSKALAQVMRDQAARMGLVFDPPADA